MALLEAACEIENNVEAGLVYVIGQTQCCVGRMGFRVGGSGRQSKFPTTCRFFDAHEGPFIDNLTLAQWAWFSGFGHPCLQPGAAKACDAFFA
jgi:hypothetical protein